MLVEAGVLLCTAVLLLYIWLIWNNNHWKRLGIPYLEPELFFGNIKDMVLVRKFKSFVYDELYRQGDEPVLGIFLMRQPQLLIRDAALCKILAVNEFSSFQANDLYVEPTDFIHSTHTFFLTGQKWKDARAVVSPGVTVSKLKAYFPYIMEACRDMIENLNQNIDKELEASEFSSLYATDTIMSCVYGLKSNSYTDPERKYKNAIENVVNPGFWGSFKFLVSSMFPTVGHFFKIKFTTKMFFDFYTHIISETVNYRKDNNVSRNDFLQYILDASGKNGNPEYSVRDITGFTMNLVADGILSTANGISLILENLLRYPEERIKLIQQIDEKITNLEDMSYENINSVTYLNAVINETFRMRPQVPVMERLCTKDCEINYGGQIYKFKKGDKIAASIYSYHMDPKYFPAPDEFQPERFLDSEDHLGYWPFGLGPRTCIGKLLSLIQTKIFLCSLLKSFEIIPSRELKPQVEYDPTSMFLLTIKDGVWFKVKKR